MPAVLRAFQTQTARVASLRTGFGWDFGPRAVRLSMREDGEVRVEELDELGVERGERETVQLLDNRRVHLG